MVEDETMTDRSDGVLGLEFDFTLLFCSSLNIIHAVASENYLDLIVI